MQKALLQSQITVLDTSRVLKALSITVLYYYYFNDQVHVTLPLSVSHAYDQQTIITRSIADDHEDHYSKSESVDLNLNE